MEKIVVAYRVCRVERIGNRWAFTIPLDNWRFANAKEAHKHIPAFRHANTSLWVQEMFSDGTFSEAPKSAEELGLKEPDPPKPPHLQYRICRIERINDQWIFTLPLSTRRYDTVKEAREYLQRQAASVWAGGPGNTNQLWVQSVVDGKYDETPKTVEELEQQFGPITVDPEPQQ